MKNVIEAVLTVYNAAMALYESIEGGLYKAVQAKAHAVKITTLGAAERLWSLVLAARSESVSIAELSFAEDGNSAQRGLATKPYCRVINYLPLETTAVATASDGCMQVVKRFSKAMLNIRFNGASAKYIRSTFYRAGDDWFVTVPGTKAVTCLTQTLSDSEAAAMVFDDGIVRKGVLVYNDLESERHATLSATAGQKKQYTLTFFCDNLEGFNPREVHYLMTYGLSELAATGSEKSQKDMASGSNRLSQFEAPNTPGIELNVFGVFMGKFGHDYRDGFAFVTNKFVAKLFTSLSGGKYLVTPKAVLGMLLQCRPYLCKLMAETVRAAYLNHFLNRNGLGKASGNRVYINRDAMKRAVENGNVERYRKVQDAFNRACDKDKTSPFWGKLVIIHGDNDRKNDIEFMTDINGLKATFDVRLSSTLNILSMSHDTHDVEDGATLSQQLLTSLLIVNFRKTVKFVLKSFIRFVQKKMERLDSAEAGHVHADELDNPQYGQLLVKMVPHIATKWYYPLLKTVVNATVEGLVHRAARQSIPTKGCYCKIVTDPAADFGKQILKYNVDGKGLAEVLLPAASRNHIRRGIGIKYPKQHFREYLKFRVLTVEEYVARVNKCDDLTAFEKALLIDKVRHLSAGGIVTPAYELLKNMLAGMDFDGDALIAYLDEELYEILAEQEPLAVVMDEDDPAAQEVEEKEEGTEQVAAEVVKTEAVSFKASFFG